MDPNNEYDLPGGTPYIPLVRGRYGYNVIYVETVRDTTLGSNIALDLQNPAYAAGYAREYMGELFGTVAHEIGHVPSNQTGDEDHEEVALMREGGVSIIGLDSSFSLPTIKRFRGR